MNEPLQTLEENTFDPLTLLDDLIETLDNDDIAIEPVGDFDDIDDTGDEGNKTRARQKPLPDHKTDLSSEIPPFQLDQELLFRELIEQHQRRLYRFVIKYIDHPDDAADITQQAFVEAARTISSFRGDSKLSTWLFGIAMNMVRNYLSRAPHRIYKFETDDVLSTVVGSAPDPSDSFEQKQIIQLVETAFSDLPEEMSEVLGLVAIDEISYQDAAEMLSIPLGTVRSRVSRARAVLRTHFQQAGVSLKF
jgi:RNA polymerase sigma factor (sigma-70 family)